MKYLTLVSAFLFGSFAFAFNEPKQKPENNTRDEIILNDIRHKPRPPIRNLLFPDFGADLSYMSGRYDVLFVSPGEDVYYFDLMVD